MKSIAEPHYAMFALLRRQKFNRLTFGRQFIGNTLILEYPLLFLRTGVSNATATGDCQPNSLYGK